ncbi:MAG: type II toxin-antitoxin system HicB family antitoxin [Symploca sp. SIO2E6]|nr:type II toxin-antitoxin system HicB family antitoxin [Symploca sp. SIO2E6]
MIFKIEVEQEEDGRWLAEIPELSGVMLYGQTLEEAKTKVQALALRVIAERLESGEAQSDLISVTFNAA